MRSVFAYTASRLLLFAIAYGIVLLIGARGFLALVLALLVSGLVSFVVLTKQRDAMSASVATGVARMRGVSSRLETGAAHEDAVHDTVRTDSEEWDGGDDASVSAPAADRAAEEAPEDGSPGGDDRDPASAGRQP